jgi:hypothetical protein
MDISEAKIKEGERKNIDKEHIGVKCFCPMIIAMMRKKKMTQKPVHKSMIIT